MRLRAESGCTPALSISWMPTRSGPAATPSPAGSSWTASRSMSRTCKLDPEYNFGNAPTIGDYRAVLAVPLMRDGAVEGVLLLGRPAPGPFSQRQIDLVRSSADARRRVEGVLLLGRPERTVQPAPDRSRADLRRPGGHRDRERASVRTGAGAHQGAFAVARRAAHRAGPPGADRKARLARPAHRRHRARDQEPAQFRQQFLGAVGRTDRRAERCAQAGRARRQDPRGDRRTHPYAEGQSRKGGAARQARRLDRQEHAAAFARGLGRASARRYQRDRRGKPQSRLSRRAGGEIRLQHHAASATSIPLPE